MKQIQESELILNKDGSVYHLNLLPEELADIVINVGDPDRVEKVSAFFSSVEIKKQKREFVTHTGYYNNQRITVLSTGIGTDNIDIVYNELDALVNINLKTRQINDQLKSLKLVRIGTSGALQADIPVDSFVCSEYGLGLDGLLNFYHPENTSEEKAICDAFSAHYPSECRLPAAYITRSPGNLFETLSKGMFSGITASCSGFYGPQGRTLRLSPFRADIVERLNSFKYGNLRITNFEMETGAMYGLARLLGHECCSANVIVANRLAGQYSKNADNAMNQLIENVLDKLTGKS